MNGKVEKVCVAGTGKLAIQCAAYAKKKGMPVTLYDMGLKKSVILEKQAAAAEIPCFYRTPEEVFEALKKEEAPLLLVSAINERILPAEVLAKENIRAVNLHQALLPAHPGRNAEAWAIFEQDEKAGITWHYMVEKVDGGGILLQKEIELDESMTAYQLFKKQIECAYEAYVEIFDSLIEGTIREITWNDRGNHKFHYKKDVPGEGILDLSWSGKKISAFLRAMDYAGLSVFQKPRLLYEGKAFAWRKYEIQPRSRDSFMESKKQMLQVTDSDIMIQKETTCIILKNYEIVEE
ncbi:MAG: hypothetical protein HDR22_04090 [Lachnospiraceae bacterium]|nr:hypothetical protein [Lachnospiraceae bacterium]